MKPNELCASIDGIQTEGEYKISVRSFIGDAESAESNQVITRVKKKATTTATADTTDSKTETLSSSSDYENNEYTTTATTTENTSIESSKSKKSQNHSDSNTSIEKKMNISNSSLTKHLIMDEHEVIDYKVKQGVGSRLAQNLKINHSFLSETEKNQLNMITATQSSLSNISPKFTSKSKSNAGSNASIASTVSFECQLSDVVVPKSSFDKLIENIGPVVINNKDVISRVSSQPLVADREHFTDYTTTTSTVKSPKSHVSVFANFANNVKFSNSEPNLSNHNLNKTDSSTTTGGAGNESVSSLLRHSIAINDDSILDQEDFDENNFIQPYSQYGAAFDISELNSNSN